MQGIYINHRRPASKKAVKDAVAAGEFVALESTSIDGSDYDGPVAEAPAGRYGFVGPDPYRNRKFYGTIVITPNGTIKVS